MVIRIALDIALFASAVLLPWWVTVALMIAVLFYLPHFYEAVIFGFTIDALYAIPENVFGGLEFVFTLGFAMLVLIVEYVKTKIRLYDTHDT